MNRFENLEDFIPVLNQKINNAKRGVMFLHKSPDFDSLGSNFGFVDYLKSFNPNIEIIVLSADPLSKDMTDFSIRSNLKVTFQDPSAFQYQEGDLAISIDFAEITRTTRNLEFKLPDFVDQVIMDHHVIPNITDKTNFISQKYISASSIIYNLYNASEIELPKLSFEFLILGLLGDSGFLKFKDNFFLNSLEIIKDYCERFGTDSYFEIIKAFEGNKPAEELALQQIFLKNYKFNQAEKYMYTSITLKEREDAGISINYSSIINGASLISNYEGALFTFSVSEDKYEKNKYNISLRSNAGSNFEVRPIAEKLGGGGHPAAAGAQITANTIDEAIEKVKNIIKE